MTTSKIPTTAVPGEPTEATTAPAPRMRRMSFRLLMVYVAILAVNSGGNGILLPNIVAGIDEAGKIGNLAIVTTVAFVANIFAQPIAGALSDATRSRFGRRTPWMVAGALLTGGFVLGLPMAQSVFTVALVWLVVQVGVNVLQAAATAVVPDRYPAARRGGVSAMIGVGITIGNAVGVTVAGSTAGQGSLPYVVLAGLVVLVVGVFVVVNRDEPSTHLPHERTGAREFLRGFWVSPRQHPDFAWAFASRFLMVIGFFAAWATRSPTPSPPRWASSCSWVSCSRRRSAAGSPTASAGASPSSSGPRSSCRSPSPSPSPCPRRPASWSTRSCWAWASVPTSPSTSPS
ncbi:hypothetical protein GCM10023162_37270 [Klenkia terrae]